MNRIPLALHPCEQCGDRGYCIDALNQLTACDFCVAFDTDAEAAVAFLLDHPHMTIDRIVVRSRIE